MGVASCRTIALEGAVGHLIDVQVDVSPGKVQTTIVGRPDPALKESRERCQMAVRNSQLDWPSTQRITILLSPADLAKRGTHFDLAIAVAICSATRQMGEVDLSSTVLIGELTLDGRLRSVPGVLPMARAAAEQGIERIVVPEPQAHEAAMVPGLSVYGLRSLGQAVAMLAGQEIPEAPPVAPMSGTPLLTHGGQERLADVDLADLDGLEVAKFALEVAAAGAHPLLLSGPKGSGKTSLIERLPGLLPDLTSQESLDVTVLHSLAGVLQAGAGAVQRPPYAAPHHSSSAASLLGGGSGRVRPGWVSLAHCGVLLLDELPLFRTDAIDGLREPLENGDVTIARGEETVTFPARPLVVAASNPCPCGNYGAHLASYECVCDAVTRRNYRRRLRGPVLDRMDIQLTVVGAMPSAGFDLGGVRETSAQVRERVMAARQRQAERYAGRTWRLNGHAPSAVLAREWPLRPDLVEPIQRELQAGRLSRRGAARVHRLAWTLCDLAGTDAPGALEVETALCLRLEQPLPSMALGRAG